LKGDTGNTGPQGLSVTSVTSNKVGDVTTVTVYIDGVAANTFTVTDGADGGVQEADALAYSIALG